jgi:hypothetical protein
MKLCFLGIHSFSNWSEIEEKRIYDDDDDVPAENWIIQIRYCRLCNIAKTRSIRV